MKDRARGCLLGVALGDALGARREGGLLGAAIWAAITTLVNRNSGTLRWTDDTQQTLVLTRRLIADRAIDPDALAADWAAAYQWWRGYGRGMAAMLRRVRKGTPWQDARLATFPDGSLGNGGAMRAAPIGLFYPHDHATRDQAARTTAAITHAHPKGIEAGALVAHATALALQSPPDLLTALIPYTRDPSFEADLTTAATLIDASPRTIRRTLGNGVRADTSVPAALLLGARSRTWQTLIDDALALGGDTDTIAAMAGAIFGARVGATALPDVPHLESRDELITLADALVEARP